MIWLLIANAGLCRIYQFNRKEKTVFLVEEHSHLKSRSKNSNLVSDRLGRYNTNHLSHGAFSPHEEPKRIEMEVFARKIGKIVELARKKGRFQELILIASPHMHGLIQQYFRADLLKYTAINRNYFSVPEHKLVETLTRDLEKENFLQPLQLH